MSAILDIKRVAEVTLDSITPALPTGYEGDSFEAPSDSMYQLCFLKINPPTDPVFPAGYHRENAVFNVFVVDVLGRGSADAIARAELIRTYFKKGLTFIENSTRIHILETPQIMGIASTKDRLIVPVQIQLTGEVYDY